MATLYWRVTGMTCPSCERIIEQELLALPGAEEAEVSLRQRRAAVRFSDGADTPNLQHLYQTLKQHGYALTPESERAEYPQTDCAIPVRTPIRHRIRRALVALALTGLVALLIWKPLTASIPSISSGSSFGAMLFFGILASVSSCLAATGGFLLAYTAKTTTALQAVAVHMGRLAAFVLGGGVLGALGSSLPSLSGSAYGALALVLGIGFLVVGLNLLDLSPSLASFGVRLPKRVSGIADRLQQSKKPYAPFAVGAATFVLPCGFTQTAQALALASGSAESGMLMLGAFALGTLPVLTGVTAFGRAAGVAKQQVFRLAAGAMLFFFAFGQIDGGLTLLGSPVTPGTFLSRTAPKNASAATAQKKDGEQLVRMTIANGTYQPNNLIVQAGVPVRWEIEGQDIYGCASDITIPSLGIYSRLNKGKNILAFTPPDRPGTIPFSCGMGMIRGTITVVN